MFNRPLLKSRAKAVLGTCYWRAVAISVVVSIISSLAGGLFRIRVSDTIMLGSPFRTALFLLTTGCFFVLNLAISVFLLQPLSLGIYKFHLDSADGKFSDICALTYGFRGNYKNTVAVLFAREILLLLLVIVPSALSVLSIMGSGMQLRYAGIGLPNISLTALNIPSHILTKVTFVTYLLLIPAVIKYYDWRLVQYILIENPDISWRDALGRSKALMRSNRFAAFKLDLSFLGWLLLGVMACGFGAIFVVPYIEATNVQLYLELSGRSTIDADENYYENI